MYCLPLMREGREGRKKTISSGSTSLNEDVITILGRGMCDVGHHQENDEKGAYSMEECLWNKIL